MNTLIMDGALWNSLSILTHDMEVHTNVAVLKSHNANNKTARVAGILEKVHQTR